MKYLTRLNYLRETRRLAGQTKVVHSLSYLPNQLASTLTWDRQDLILSRMQYADSMMLFPGLAQDFWQKPWRKRAYQCASCHSP